MKEHEHKVRIAKMRISRMMCGHIRKDKIQNDHIQERVGDGVDMSKQGQ